MPQNRLGRPDDRTGPERGDVPGATCRVLPCGSLFGRRGRASRKIETHDCPTFVVHFPALGLPETRPRQEAWELESPLKPLQAFREEMGRAIFVSHQWLSAKHPDPHRRLEHFRESGW